ncbi:MAG: PAS domain S-box protein [Bacteroidales bacterium]|nr:PAS domain S-box protein [Bacteroidales bacterium]
MQPREHLFEIIKQFRENSPKNEPQWQAMLDEIIIVLNHTHPRDAHLSQYALNHSPDAIYWFNSDASIVYANKKAYEQLGYSLEEITKKSLFDIDPYFPIETWKQEWAKHLSTKYFKGKSIHRKKDGSEFPVEISSNLLEFEGEQFNCAFIRDISLQQAYEKKLQQSVHKYKLLAENVNDVIWTMNINLQFTYISPSIEKLRGYTAEEVMQQPIFEVFTPDSLLIASGAMGIGTKLIKQGITNIPTQILELEQPCKDGSTVWTEVIVNAIFDENKQFDSFLGVTRNIGERKKQQLRLIENEEYLKEAEKMANIGHWVLDIPNNHLYWSDEIYHMFGYDPQGFTATYETFLKNVHPDDREYVNNAYTSSLKNKTPYNIVHRLFLTNNIIKYVNEKCRTEYDNNDQAIRSIGTIQDITKQVLAEKEQNRQFLLQKLIANIAYKLNSEQEFENYMPDVIKEIGMELQITAISIFRYTYLNDLSKGQLSYFWRDDIETNPEIKINQIDFSDFPLPENILNSDNLFPVSDINKLPEKLADFLKSFNMKAIVIAPLVVGLNKYGFISFDDRHQIRNWKDTELETMKTITNMIALAFQREQTFTDLQIAKEDAENADRLKSAFLTTMSHELRTPLNAVIGYSELLKEFKSPDDIEEYSTIINQSGIRLLNIIEEILNFSILESGDYTLQTDQFDYVSLSNDLLDFFKPKIKKEGKNINLKCIDQVNCSTLYLRTDKQKLSQIFIALLNNAVKYTKEGSIQFGCSGISNENIEFYVRDTGIGIPPEKFKIIFEKFRQLDDSNTRLYGGTGLGLSICEKTITLLGGKIWVESEVGIGSIFYFTIPYKYEDSPVSLSDQINDNDFSGIQILIVEDEYSNYMLLETIFEMKGAEVLYAENGSIAIEMVRKNKDISLILMDLKMPVMDGFEATKIIKSIAPHIPVIAQTAYAFKDDDIKAIAAGCDEFLTKPIKKNDILIRAKKLIKNQSI